MQTDVGVFHTADMFRAIRPLVLASASPRRRDFLRELGIACRIMPPPGGAEPLPLLEEAPEVFVARAAKAKADSVHAALTAECRNMEMPVVLGADTVVFRGTRIYGKPADEKEAFQFLVELAGREHTVLTACWLRLDEETGVAFSGSAKVFMGAWPESVLRAYANGGEGLDKAGGYAVQGQGGFLVERLEGSWSAVIGLPVAETVTALIRNAVIKTY